MTNVHPFPKRAASKKTERKHATAGPAFYLQDPYGDDVDMLMAVIQAGGLYLGPTQERPPEDLLTTQLLRTIDGLNALTDAANALVMHARQHPEGFDQEAADALIHQGKQAHKVIRKLYDMLPSDEFITTMDSYGPDLMAEYATNAAMVVTTGFAMAIMAYYCKSFIKTGKDQRKNLFRDFQGVYQDARDECLFRSEGHEFLIKELASANRSLQKVLKAL